MISEGRPPRLPYSGEASDLITALGKNFVILDTEYTAWEGSKARNWRGPGEFRELVEIAAIRVEAGTLVELEHFRRLVRPRINRTLSAYFSRLTGISQQDVDSSGADAAEAIMEFSAWSGSDRIFCFGADGDVIRENLTLYSLSPALLPSKVGDIRSVFRGHGVEMAGLSSGNCTRAFGHEPRLEAHSGLNDVRTILEALRLLETLLVRRSVERPLEAKDVPLARSGECE